MPDLRWEPADHSRMPSGFVADVGRKRGYRVEPHGSIDNTYWMVSVPVDDSSSLVPCGYPTAEDAKEVAQTIHNHREANA